MFSEKILAVTAATFEQEVIQSSIPVVVDFWGTTCVPCQQIAPRFEELAVKAGERVKFVSVNVEENKELARELGLRSVPAFRIYRNGVKHYECTGIQNFAGLQMGVGQLVGTLLREQAALDAEPNTAEPTEVHQKIDVLISGEAAQYIHIGDTLRPDDCIVLTPGTKVLLINQVDPKNNGIRIIGGQTDLDRVKDMFGDLGIGYKQEHTNVRDFRENGVVTTLELKSGMLKVGGYNDFISVYHFDHNGKFMFVNNWE